MDPSKFTLDIILALSGPLTSKGTAILAKSISALPDLLKTRNLHFQLVLKIAENQTYL